MIYYIAFGGAIGSVTRYLVGVFIQTRAGGAFPMGTLVINITGSMLLGFLLQYTLSSATVSPEVRALLTTGFCGGYTTFSTFSYEAVRLFEEGDYWRFGAYIGASVVLGLIGCIVGMMGAKSLLALRRGV
jgi:CrcB protein